MNWRTLPPLRPQALLLMLFVLPMGGCDPIFDVAGAYFPSWIISLLVGGGGTLIIRDILVRLGLDTYIGWKVLAYLGLFTMLSTTFWLIFFST